MSFKLFCFNLIENDAKTWNRISRFRKPRVKRYIYSAINFIPSKTSLVLSRYFYRNKDETTTLFHFFLLPSFKLFCFNLIEMMRRLGIEFRALENRESSIIFILGIEPPLIRATMIYHRNGTKAGTRTREIIRNSLSSVPFDSSPFPPPPRRSFSLLSTILSLFHC